METLDKQEILLEIDRLQNLLAEKRKEYEIFGRTDKDAEVDFGIKQKIVKLKESLISLHKINNYNKKL